MLEARDEYDGTRMMDLWDFIFRAREYPGFNGTHLLMWCPPASRYIPMIATVTSDRSRKPEMDAERRLLEFHPFETTQ